MATKAYNVYNDRMDTPTSPMPSVPTPAPMPPPMPPISVMPAAAKKGGSSVWLTVIIVIVLIAAYGAYAYISGMWPFTQGMPAYTATPTPSASMSPTADWKLYTSQKLGITFEYPPDWTVTEGNDYPGSAQGEDYVKITKGSDVIYAGSKTQCLAGATYCKALGMAPSFSTVSTNPDVPGIIDLIVANGAHVQQ